MTVLRMRDSELTHDAYPHQQIRRVSGSKIRLIGRRSKRTKPVFSRNEREMLLYGHETGMLRSFRVATIEGLGRDLSGQRISVLYLRFIEMACWKEVPYKIFDYFKTHYGDLCWIRWHVHERVGAIVLNDTVNCFIPVAVAHGDMDRLYQWLRGPDVPLAQNKDSLIRTRYGYAEGRGEFFRHLSEKRYRSSFALPL